MDHPVFGEVCWQPLFSWWFAQVPTPSGGFLDLILDPGDSDPDDFLEQATRLYVAVMWAERHLLQKAIELGILGLYEAYRPDDEPRLMAADLFEQLQFVFLRIATGEVPFTLSYDPGEVFDGQVVDVTVDRDLRVRDVGLIG